MTAIAIENLSASRQTISHKGIADAAEALDTAKANALTAKRDAEQARQELPASEWKDAELVDKAVAAGEKPPAKRAHTVKHEQLIRDLEFAEKPAQLAEARCREALKTALAEHGPDYLAEAEERIAETETAWNASLAKLKADHASYAAAVRVGRAIGSTHLPVEASKLDRKQLQGIELAHLAASSWPIYVQDLLGALEAVGTDEATPSKRVPVGVSAQVEANLRKIGTTDFRRITDEDVAMRGGRKDPGVDREIQEREDFMHRQMGEDVIAARG